MFELIWVGNGGRSMGENKCLVEQRALEEAGEGRVIHLGFNALNFSFPFCKIRIMILSHRCVVRKVVCNP